MHVGMSVLFRERNDLDAATRHLLASRELGEHAGFSQNPHRWRVAMARVREAEGDLAAAVELLDEAERLYNGDFSPDVRPIPALGRGCGWRRATSAAPSPGSVNAISASMTTSPTCGSSSTSPSAGCSSPATGPSAQASFLHDATRLLERLLAAAEEGRRVGSLIEILVLRALAHQAQRRRSCGARRRWNRR